MFGKVEAIGVAVKISGAIFSHVRQLGFEWTIGMPRVLRLCSTTTYRIPAPHAVALPPPYFARIVEGILKKMSTELKSMSAGYEQLYGYLVEYLFYSKLGCDIPCEFRVDLLKHWISIEFCRQWSVMLGCCGGFVWYLCVSVCDAILPLSYFIMSIPVIYLVYWRSYCTYIFVWLSILFLWMRR